MKIKFIYINNSKVAKWLCGKKIKSSIILDGNKVFFNRMLSGGCDDFSKKRLENEIKEYLSKKLV